MSVESLAVVLNHSKAKGTAKLVLLGIANHDGDGGAWCSVATLARYANVDERNVQRAVAKLVDSRELRVDVNAGGTHKTPEDRRPNLYTLLLQCPPWCDRTGQHRDTRKLAGPQLQLGGVAKTSPRYLHGVAQTSPRGVAQTSPEPPNEPSPNAVVPQVLDTRACQTCTQPEGRCQSVQAAWPPADRHPYLPVVARATG